MTDQLFATAQQALDDLSIACRADGDSVHATMFADMAYMVQNQWYSKIGLVAECEVRRLTPVK